MGVKSGVRGLLFEGLLRAPDVDLVVAADVVDDFQGMGHLSCRVEAVVCLVHDAVGQIFDVANPNLRITCESCKRLVGTSTRDVPSWVMRYGENTGFFGQFPCRIARTS